jgi:fibronectin type 3 domain-containing protein
MSWLSPRAVRRHRRLHARRPFVSPVRPTLVELESRINPANVLQYHMDALSTGLNNTETVLTRQNVNFSTFGKLWTVHVQGQVYAEPLVLTGVNITSGANQGVHNVVFVATEHDELYAYDADANTPTLLWQRSFLSDANNTNPGDLPTGATVTSVPVNNNTIISTNITVEVGISGTPVIDPNTGTIYLVAKTQEVIGGTTHFVQRLYGVNVQNGTDKTAPFLLGDTTGTNTNYASEASDPNKASNQIWTYGAGDGALGTDPYFNTGRSVVQFNALREAQRPGLTLANGAVYIAWASHGDNGPYHGWVVGVSAYSAGNPTMALKGVLNTTPNGGLGGIWMAGGEITFDGTYLYLETGNGTFDGGNGTGTGGNPTAPAPGPITGIDNAGFPIKGDYGDSFVKIGLDSTTAATQHRTLGTAAQTDHSNGWGLAVVDYFTPFNQNYLNATDKDVGSSATVIVPDYNPAGPANQFASAARPHLLIGSGKEGVIYLMNRDNMGKYGLNNNIVQNTANQLSGSLDSAALFNGQMYYVEGYGGVAKTFSFSNGNFSTTPTTQSADAFQYAGSTPFVTANGTSNGIVWDVDRGTNQLRAYSSDSYATQLYNSAQAGGGRDAMGAAVTFQVVTVANGRVFVAAGTGEPNNVLNVYGLLPPPTNVPNDPSGLVAQAINSTQISLAWTDNSVLPNNADSFSVEESPDGSTNWTQIATVPGTNPGYLLTGLTGSTTYYFRVRAHDGFGFSGYSNVTSATTPVAGPHSIDYSAGFTTANTTPTATQGGLAFNGGTQADLVPGNNRLQLTSGVGGQARSAYFTNPQADPTHQGKQYVVGFSTTFTYNMSGGAGNPADGVTFVIQNAGPTALGGGGGGLGYAGISPSFAFAINVYSGQPLGTEFLTNGNVDEQFTEQNINVQLQNAPITVTVGYAAGVVTAQVQQTINGVVQTDTKSMAVNIPALLGTDYAYVGFTGGTGGANSTQEITYWTFDQGLVPAAPANLAATVTGFTGTSNAAVPLGAHLTWTAVTDTPPAGGTVGYKILRKLTAGGAYQQIGTSTTNSFDDTGLATGSNYFYEVQATDSAGDSLPSAAVSITTPVLPPTPTNSQINSVTDMSISFQWRDNANNENGYLILRAANGGTFAIIANLPPDTNPAPSTMTFTDTGLTRGTAYDYHIESYNLAGYSDFAGVTTTTTATGPSNLAATAAANAISLTWDAYAGATGYSVYRGTSPGGEGATPIATGLTSPSYTDTTAAFNTTYYYRVTATDAGGETPRSNEASAFVAAPLTIAGVQVNDGSNQRSEVRSITVTFSGPVNFAFGASGAVLAFQLLHVQTNTYVGLTAAVSTDVQGRTVVTLTFSGSETDPVSGLNGGAPSLADGRYQLTVFSANVTGAGGAHLAGGGPNNNYVSPTDAFGGTGLRLYRLFGDATGDGVVDATDLGQFRSTFNANSSLANYLAFLDADNSGAVDPQDLGQFRARFNVNVY